MKKKHYSIIAAMFLLISTFSYTSCTHKEQTLTSQPSAGLKFQQALSNGSGENPAERWDWELRRLADPATGKIPPNMRRKELQFAHQLVQNRQATSSATDQLEWLHRGPYNIGGRTRAFAADVANPSILIAGGVSGGIWRSTNSGQTWAKMSTVNEHQGITCLVQDTRPGHTQTWYYGTGEGYGNSASGNGINSFYLGDGIYKSNDNGLTWQPLSTTASGEPENFTTNFQVIWTLATDPSNTEEDEVYVATYGRIYRSTNGGTAWVSELGTGNSASYFTHVATTSTGVVYATLSSDGTQKGIWRSENGMDWVKILPSNFPQNYDRIVIGINPSNENEVYFLASNTSDGGKETFDFQGEPERNAFWKYTYLSGDGTDTGGSWEDRSQNLPMGEHQFDDFIAQGSYNLLVVVKPDDPTTVFIGGTNIYRSTDAFTTPNNTTFMGGYKEDTALPLFELYPVHHPDQHVLFFDPQNPDVLYSGNDGGIYRTSNCMAENVVWENLNRGYVTTQFYTLAISSLANDNTIIGGLQDNGTRFANQADITQPWTMPFNYDGSYCGIPNNRDYYLMSVQLGPIVKVQVDDDRQMTAFQRIDPEEAEGNYLFINPFIMNPSNNDIIYLAEGRNLWINLDVSAIEIQNTYDKTSLNWYKNLNQVNSVSGVITALGASAAAANRLYIGTEKGDIYRVSNTLDPTTPLSDVTGSQFPVGYISSIEVHPNDANKVFAVFSNYNIYSLFYTEDAGETWQKVAGNLESGTAGTGAGPSFRDISILPITPDSTAYFLGTSVGLFFTDSLAGTSTQWQRLAEDAIGNTVVEAIETRIADQLVVVGTHGNGVFSANTPADIPAATYTPASANNLNIVLQNPTINGELQLSLPATSEPLSFGLYSQSGKLVLQQQWTNSNAPQQTSLSIAHLPAGIYIWRAESGRKHIASGKVMIGF